MIYYILFLHWVADFCVQTSWVSQNKATSWYALLFHAGLYTLVLGLGCTFLHLETSTLITYIIINGGLHLAIDSITAPISKKFRDNGDTHKMFCVIGGEQFLHSCCLIFTTSFLN